MLQQKIVPKNTKRKLRDRSRAKESNSKICRKETTNTTPVNDMLEISPAAENSDSILSGVENESFSCCIADLSFESVDTCGDELLFAANTRAHFEIDIDTRRTQNTKHEWTIDSVWSSLEKATAYLKEKQFVKYKVNDKLIKGIKIQFRCKSVPKEKKVWCSRQYQIFCPNDSTEVIVQHNNKEHDHEKVGTKKLSINMIDFLTSLFEKRTTNYEEILLHVAAARTERNMFINECDPSKVQIAYRLKKFRGKEADTMINLGDSMQWCSDNSYFPEDQNIAFVLSSKCSRLNEQRSFKFVISTPYFLDKFK